MKHVKDSSNHPYSGAAVVEMVHFLCQFVQLERTNTQDLDPEMVGVLIGRHIHIQMFIRLEAQVWTGNWMTSF